MNNVAFFEIQADDPERAQKFYSDIFDWKFVKEDWAPIDYWRIEGAGPFGGLLKRPARRPEMEQGTNAYVCSMQVDDFDATAEKILKLSGIVALPKFAVPGRCWQGYFLDPEGNTFGIFQVDEEAK
jgi:uncharacterized protein